MEDNEWKLQRRQLIVTTVIGLVAMTISLGALYHAELSQIRSISDVNNGLFMDIHLRNYLLFWFIGALGIFFGTMNNNARLGKAAEALHMRNQNEELVKLQKIQKRFIQTTAHDLRTPLTSVKGYLDLIKMGFVKFESDEFWNFITTIEKCVTRVEDLTGSLLETQKLESGNVKLELSSVPIASFVEEIDAEIKPICVEMGQKLVVDSECSGVMVVDRMKMVQVLMNLLSNASKYSPSNSVIKLDVEEEQDYVMFSISDSGIGLREEDLPKLFEPFPDIDVDGNFNRTGLGLSIVKGLVELHGGEIFAESEGLGMGSRFWFRIPLSQETE